MKFNLNLASRRYINKRVITYGFTVAFCSVLLLLGWEYTALNSTRGHLQNNLQLIAEIKQELQVLRGGPTRTLSIEERSKVEEEFAIVADLLKLDKFRWTQLLDRMESLLPEGVTLVSFRPDYKKKSLDLSGNARSLSEMRVFLDRLLEDEEFKQVFLKNHSRIKVRDYADNERDAISFSLLLEGVF